MPRDSTDTRFGRSADRRLPRLELAAVGHRPSGYPAVGGEQVPAASGLANRAQFLDTALRILETAVEHGYPSTTSARGVKFPPKELKDAPSIIAGADFLKLLAHLEEPYRTMLSLIAATGLRISELLALRWRVLELEHGTLAA